MIRTESLKNFAFFAIIALCSAVLLFILYPFYKPIIVALILSVIVFPLFNYLNRVIRSRSVSAGISILFLIVAIIIPFFAIFSSALKELSLVAAEIKPQLKTMDFGLTAKSLGVLPGMTSVWTVLSEAANIARIDAVETFSQVIETATAYLAGQSFYIIKNIVWFFAEIFIALISVFFILRDSKGLLRMLKEISPLKETETNALLAKIRDTVYATVFGGILVAMAQGFMGGIGFFMLGMPSPVLWAIVMSVLAMIPFLGAPVVWFPAVVVLFIQGSYLKAMLLFLWGAFVVGLIDNILRPIFIGTRTQLHPLLVFFSAFGGVVVLGPIGLFFGPILLAVTMIMFEFLKIRIEKEK